MPRVLVVQHEDEAPLGWFADGLAASGVDVEVAAAHRGDPIPTEVAPYGGLLVLGGAMGAYDDDRFGWLTPTKALIRDAVATDTPFLGICLGHQVATVALGGQVARNPAGIATGLTPIRRTAAGRTDPLLGPLPDDARSVQWNNDIATSLPPGAELLAASPEGVVQAARFAPWAWGVQFHPEVPPEVFARWGVTDPPPHLDVAAARAAVFEAADELAETSRLFARTFAGLVVTRGSGTRNGGPATKRPAALP